MKKEILKASKEAMDVVNQKGGADSVKVVQA